jgi:hypothetical protein
LFVRRRRAAAASCVVDKSIDCPVPDFPFPITAFLSGTATKLLRILSPLLPFVCSLPLPRQPPLLPRQPFIYQFRYFGTFLFRFVPFVCSPLACAENNRFPFHSNFEAKTCVKAEYGF